jgi:hypothetical protein
MSDDPYESGPYCQHWSDPGTCEDCARELLKGELSALHESLAAERAAREKAVEKYDTARATLIAVVMATGGCASADVSDEFLAYVPGEVAKLLKRAEAAEARSADLLRAYEAHQSRMIAAEATAARLRDALEVARAFALKVRNDACHPLADLADDMVDAINETLNPSGASEAKPSEMGNRHDH